MSETRVAPQLGSRLWRRSTMWATLYALMLPTIVGILIFTYYPNFDAVKYAFYRWDGSHVEEFRGLQNFKMALGGGDPRFWNSFVLVFILLLANLAKMWPSILVAIAIHRLHSARWQYLYRVLFVIPMVIPGLVWLLVWKALFTEGLFNQVLNATGMMSVLRSLDSGEHGLPAASAAITAAVAPGGTTGLAGILLAPVKLLYLLFGGPWGAAVAAIAVLMARRGVDSVRRLFFLWVLVAAAGWFACGPLRMPLVVLGAIGLAELARVRSPFVGAPRLRVGAILLLAVSAALILLVYAWPSATHAFDDGQPPWLGNSKLIIPSLILWGFPWVGTIGVLIYLAGLQSISQEVYEAAELDGVGSIGKIFRIELPLIMSQVRINLIFMTIGTLTDYALILILLGPNGGPDSKGLVPGLYMYQKAFLEGEFGYACALGVIMFVIVLGLTYLYQKYLKVDK